MSKKTWLQTLEETRKLWVRRRNGEDAMWERCPLCSKAKHSTPECNICIVLKYLGTDKNCPCLAVKSYCDLENHIWAEHKASLTDGAKCKKCIPLYDALIADIDKLIKWQKTRLKKGRKKWKM